MLAVAAGLAALLPARPAGALALKARSVALPGPAGTMCAMALDQTGKLAVGSVDLSGTTTVALTNCDLYNNSANIDSTEVAGGGNLSARNIFLAGGYSVSNGGSMTATGVIVTHGAVVQDPYAGLPTPLYSGCAANNYRLNANQTDTLSPGVYCGGIDVEGGAVLSLNPGTYILNQGGLLVKGGGTMSGAGVTLILTSSSGSNYGTINLNGGSTVTLSAPSQNATLGIPGIVIWEDRNAPTANAIFNGGGGQDLNGAVYLPSQQASYSGGAAAGTNCVQLIALTLSFTGNSYFAHKCANAGVSDPPNPPRVVE